MFISSSRQAIIPQQEHARFAGVLASLWGNDTFSLPKFAKNSLVKGVTFHHLGYGYFDTINFRKASDEEIIKIFENDTKYSLDDIDGELVNLFHQYRLMQDRKKRAQTKVLDKIIEKTELQIDKKLQLSKFTKEDFLWSDPITKFCDRVSFNFSFGNTVSEELSINTSQSVESIIIKHEILDINTIKITPWPFSLEKIEGFMIGYKTEGYPEKVSPIIINYTITP